MTLKIDGILFFFSFVSFLTLTRIKPFFDGTDTMRNGGVWCWPHFPRNGIWRGYVQRGTFCISTCWTIFFVGYQVPSILVSMKRSLIEYGGLKQVWIVYCYLFYSLLLVYSETMLQEGIFRLAGEQTEIKRIKEIMNKKEFVSSNDINTIASLIKVCFFNFFHPF